MKTNLGRVFEQSSRVMVGQFKISPKTMVRILWFAYLKNLRRLNFSFLYRRNQKRKREATEYLLDLLRDELCLKIDYESRYGIVSIPKGSFVPDKDSSQQIYVFGRAKRDIERLAHLTRMGGTNNRTHWKKWSGILSYTLID